MGKKEESIGDTILEPLDITCGRVKPGQGFPEWIVINFISQAGTNVAFKIDDAEALKLAIELLSEYQGGTLE